LPRGGKKPFRLPEEPEDGTRYFYLNSMYGKGYKYSKWNEFNDDKSALKNGIYLKEEHAQEAVAVIRGIMGRED
jgi:hypothetical protein